METFEKEALAQEDTFSPEQRERIRREILVFMDEVIKKYEPFYESARHSIPTGDTHLTKERYAHFEAWVGDCFQRRSCSSAVHVEVWSEEVQRVVTGYHALVALQKPGVLPPDLVEYCEIVGMRRISTWTNLPSQKALKAICKLDMIDEEYRQGRSLEEFSLKKDHLSFSGILDPALHQLLLGTKDRSRTDTQPLGRIIHVIDMIRKKQEAKPAYPDFLPTTELLFALLEQKLRPASLPELLAYAQQQWHPEAHEPKTDIPHIFALGSVFKKTEGPLGTPCLRYFHNQRELTSTNWRNPWSGGSSFLVFPQE